MKNALGRIMNLGIAGVISLWIGGCPSESYSERETRLMRERQVRVNHILQFNEIPNSQHNPLSKKDCDLHRFRIIEELVRKWAEEIIFKTNITSGLNWDEKTFTVVNGRYRGSSDEYAAEKGTFDKRHLAVSYRMRNTTTWQAFTQKEIQRFFNESGYALFFPFADGICTYSSQTGEWESAYIVGLPDSPSQELAEKLNGSQLILVPKTISP